MNTLKPPNSLAIAVRNGIEARAIVTALTKTLRAKGVLSNSDLKEIATMAGELNTKLYDDLSRRSGLNGYFSFDPNLDW